jgi:hypothetical protein
VVTFEPCIFFSREKGGARTGDGWPRLVEKRCLQEIVLSNSGVREQGEKKSKTFAGGLVIESPLRASLL